MISRRFIPALILLLSGPGLRVGAAGSAVSSGLALGYLEMGGTPVGSIWISAKQKAADGATAGGAGEPLDPARLPPAWRELVAELQSYDTVRAEFVELRTFRVRPQPVALQGEMRLARERGLSLHYTSPEERTIVVDDRGVLLRDARGRSRSAPASAAASTRPLLDVLHFNLPALGEHFAITGARDDDRWRLELDPLAPEGRDAPRRIVVTGTTGRVDTIRLEPSGGQRIEITIGDVRTDVAFTDEELQRYFR